MTTRFVQVSWGLQYTDVFLSINTAKSYIQSFQNGREVDSTTKISESIALSAQDRMEEEINQHIRISDKLAKEELFEYLTGWANYFEYNLLNPQKIERVIEEYNENRLIEYKKIVEEEEAKFKQTAEYKTLNNLDFYEVKYGYGSLSSIMQKAMFGDQQRMVQYRKFFEAPNPDLIDIDYLPAYLEVINPIISRCINIARKRLSYLKGENELNKLPQTEVKELLTTVTIKPVQDSIKKLKFKLSVDELAYLFRLLYDFDMIDIKSKAELKKFILANMSTKGSENISDKSLGNKLSTTEKAEANYWADKLMDMYKAAKKV